MKRILLVGVACGALFFAAAQPASAQLQPVIDLLGIADTGVGMRDEPGQVSAGEQFNYVLNVRNHGPSAATDVRVQTRLADSLNFVGATGEVLTEPGDPPPPPVECVAPRAKLVNCHVERLEGGSPGQRARIVVTVGTTAAGFPKSRASVESQSIDLNPNNNSTQEGTSVR